MSNWAIVGHCPRCGAPIFAVASYTGETPPPVNYSCLCAMHAPPGRKLVE